MKWLILDPLANLDSCLIFLLKSATKCSEGGFSSLFCAPHKFASIHKVYLIFWKATTFITTAKKKEKEKTLVP